MVAVAPSALSRAYSLRLLTSFSLSVSIAVSAFVAIFVVPFFTGFDLNNIAREEGVRPVDFSREDGAQVQNQFSGISAYFFEGPLAGSQARLDSLEQILGTEQPDLRGLNILGQSETTGGLAIDALRPSTDGQYLEADQGVSGSYAGNLINAESVRFDPTNGSLIAFGETRIVNGSLEIQTEQGARISSNGNIQIGTGVKE